MKITPTQARKDQAAAFAAQLGLDPDELYEGAVAAWSNLNPQSVLFSHALSVAGVTLRAANEARSNRVVRTLAQAREIVANSPDLQHLFGCELYNEGEGGASPATLDSTVDSLDQAPEDVVRIMLTEDSTGDSTRGLIDLIRVLMLIDASTELRDLL